MFECAELEWRDVVGPNSLIDRVRSDIFYLSV